MKKNSTTVAPRISKSQYLQGMQCHKLCWTVCNAKNLIPAPDGQMQAAFDQGRAVGDLAKRLFPGGIEIGRNVDVDNFEGIFAESEQALTHRFPLYEAAFAYRGGFARVDILVPVGDNAWNLVEVKSTTGIEEVHLHDLAFQLYVLTGAGLRIERCILAHIASAFVKNGPVDPEQFFVLEDVTTQVAALSESIESKLDSMLSTIRLPKAPEIQIGRHCDKPYTCMLRHRCWNNLPSGNVTELYRGGAKRFKLLAKGIMRLKEIPDDFPLTESQKIQQQTAITGKPHVDKAAIKAFLSQFEYPISYLDFETFSTAIPIFNGTRPYTQIPFQFSLHIVHSPGVEPEHFKFLAEGTNDPRPEFMRRLREALPEEGSVVIYNAQFELGRLKECSDLMPEFQPWVCSFKRRIIDLLLPFRGFRFYAPVQKGSASMKSVLPVLTGRGYEHLEIRDGTMASLQFLRATFGSASPEARAIIRRHLEDYCGLDTMGMILIVDALCSADKP